MAKSSQKIDPLGDDPELIDPSLNAAPPTPDAHEAELVELRAANAALREQLENAQVELELERERADAAEEKLKGDSAAFDPTVPHVVKSEWRSALSAGRGTIHLRPGQVLTDPAVIAMVHDLGAPIARQ